MDEYFVTKKAVQIILDNLNDHFVKCLITLSMNEKYTENIKLIIGIIELVKTYLTTRRNDLLSSCIKYTNKAYYLHLGDSLFRLIQKHLESIYNTNKYIFIYDLISKYNNPFIPGTTIIRNFNDNAQTRFNSNISYANEYESNEDNEDNEDNEGNEDNTKLIAKDAGTLFKDAYNKLKASKALRLDMKDIELSNLNKSDLL